MNKWGKKLMIAGLCACMTTAGFSGCGPKADTAIATLDGTPVEFGVASFMVRYSQAQMQAMYGAYLGEDYWASNGASSRDGVMDTLQEMLVLEQHMKDHGVTVSEEEKGKITEAAKAFMDANDGDVVKAMGVDQATVERTLTLYTIQTKMRNAVVADVDINVPDEEAAQKTIQYEQFSTAGSQDEEGNTTDLTDEEKSAIKDQAQKLLDQVKESGDLEAALKSTDEEKTVKEASYGKDNGELPDEVKAAADKLTKDGQAADALVETENGYYVIVMKSTFDKAATEKQKQTIVSNRKNEKFKEVYEAWKKEAKFVEDEKVVEKITFQDIYEMKVEETESQAATEGTTESQAGTETEVITESQTGTETEVTTESSLEKGTEAVSEAQTSAETES